MAVRLLRHQSSCSSLCDCEHALIHLLYLAGATGLLRLRYGRILLHSPLPHVALCSRRPFLDMGRAQSGDRPPQHLGHIVFVSLDTLFARVWFREFLFSSIVFHPRSATFDISSRVLLGICSPALKWVAFQTQPQTLVAALGLIVQGAPDWTVTMAPLLGLRHLKNAQLHIPKS